MPKTVITGLYLVKKANNTSYTNHPPRPGPGAASHLLRDIKLSIVVIVPSFPQFLVHKVSVKDGARTHILGEFAGQRQRVHQVWPVQVTPELCHLGIGKNKPWLLMEHL